jgi:hypothetical protein
MGDGLDVNGQPLPNTVVTNLFMLPPRPLQDLGGNPAGNGLYLITLVDDRYFWWFSNVGSFSFTAGVTTWADLLNIGLAAVNNPPSVIDPVPAAYDKPAAGVQDPYTLTPLFLDYVAYLVGMRIWRGFDGTVNIVGPATDIATENTNVQLISSQHCGGAFGWATPFPGQQADLDSVTPTQITVLFPETVSGSPNGSLYPITTTTASLALPQFTGVNPNGWTKTVLYPTPATMSGGVPTNLTTLTTLAQQFTGDWLQSQLGVYDLVINRVFPWQGDGLDQSVVADYSLNDSQKEHLTTRVQRPPFNDLFDSVLPPNLTSASFNLTVRDTQGDSVSNVNLITMVSPNLTVAAGAAGEAVVTDTDSGGGGGSDEGAVVHLTTTSISGGFTPTTLQWASTPIGCYDTGSPTAFFNGGTPTVLSPPKLAKYYVWFYLATATSGVANQLQITMNGLSLVTPAPIWVGLRGVASAAMVGGALVVSNFAAPITITGFVECQMTHGAAVSLVIAASNSENLSQGWFGIRNVSSAGN